MQFIACNHYLLAIAIVVRTLLAVAIFNVLGFAHSGFTIGVGSHMSILLFAFGSLNLLHVL